MIISRTSPLMRLRKTAAETTPAERMTLSLLEEGPAGRDRVEATVFLFDAAHFYLPVDFFSLVQGGQAQAGQRGGGRAGGYTPAQRIREIAVTFHGPRESYASVKSPLRSMDHAKAAAKASPAPMGQSTSTRGGRASMMVPSMAPMAPRLPSESATISGPMARIRATASRK